MWQVLLIKPNCQEVIGCPLQAPWQPLLWQRCSITLLFSKNGRTVTKVNFMMKTSSCLMRLYVKYVTNNNNNNSSSISNNKNNNNNNNNSNSNSNNSNNNNK